MKKYKRLFFIFVMLSVMVVGYFGSQLQLFERVSLQFTSNLPHQYENMVESRDFQCRNAAYFTEKLTKKQFQLVSWNIHKGMDKGWQQDLTRLAQDQDFVLLQEATPKQNLANFSTALFVSSFRFKNEPSGVKILSQTLPQWYCGGMVAEPLIQIPKVASAVNFSLENGQSLLLINVHLVNFEWGISAYKAQLEQIFTLLVARHQGPVIIAGDFNTWNAKRTHLVNEFAENYALKAVSLAADKRVTFLGYPLDHIFVRGLSNVKATSEAVSSSDHHPLKMVFEIE